MTLIIGGAGQGKLAYALDMLQLNGEQVSSDPRQSAPVISALERWMREEENPIPALEALLEERPDVVILCDEVGSGVVPVDAADRRWRERVGRTCCELAKRAECVIRLYCGIPTVLKGETPWN